MGTTLISFVDFPSFFHLALLHSRNQSMMSVCMIIIDWRSYAWERPEGCPLTWSESCRQLLAKPGCTGWWWIWWLSCRLSDISKSSLFWQLIHEYDLIIDHNNMKYVLVLLTYLNYSKHAARLGIVTSGPWPSFHHVLQYHSFSIRESLCVFHDT